MMAAISMPSYHSASQRGGGFENLPAAIKRTRDPSEDSDIPQFTKKPKLFSQTLSRPKSVRTYSKKEPTFRETLVKDAVTQVNSPRDRGTVQQTADRESTPISKATEPATRPTIIVKEPTEIIKQEEKRTLRAQDGAPRSKSELASYFSNYEEIMFNEPRDPGSNAHHSKGSQPLLTSVELLTADTRINIVDDPGRTLATASSKAATSKNISRKSRHSNASGHSSVKTPLPQPSTIGHPDTLILIDSQVIELPALDYTAGGDGDDPLSDEVYAKAHRRAERSEKQLRNIEKERAMHEKAQLERLLDGLKGHDWLKIIGVSGVTDGERKSWEPKREYFIQEVEILLDKFREWKEEEKRRKAKREGRNADDIEDGDEGAPNGMETSDDSDVDACAAKQLHQETTAGKGRQKRGYKGEAKQTISEKPFTSFYSKPYLREAALGKHRRGRTRLAFGQPLPDVPEREFSLPESLRTPDALASSARSKRRARRGSKT